MNEQKAKSKGLKFDIKSMIKWFFRQREASIFIIIVLTIIIVSLLQPRFLNTSNMRIIATGLSADGLMAIGMSMVLILGGIELSVGSVSAMTSVIAGSLVLSGHHIGVAILVAVSAGVIVGLFNGFMISKIGLPPFIVTLGMLSLARGIAFIFTMGSPLSMGGYLPDWFRFLGTGVVFGLPMIFLIFLTVTIVAHLMMKNAYICRQIFYIGSNEKAARLSAVNVDRVKIGVYLVVAMLSTLAGILSLARFNVATPELARMAEVRAISAAVIGGASMSGGVGSIIGAFLGVVLLNIVNSALVMLHVSVYWQEFVQGTILILVVTLDYLSRRRKLKNL